ncbi:MAG: inorganic phosphate transporter family protein [Methanomicrobiales archaeon]|nr:inorganic phosphate transporter family protein [Methanomicrobiales archaeon]
MDFLSLLTYPVAFYLMFSSSGDNTAASMGPVVGSGVRSFWEVILIIAVFGTLGAVLQGSAVEQTLGGGIIMDALPGYAAVIIILTTALWGSGFLLGFVPVSTAYAVIGASIGTSLYLGTTLNWQLIGFIVLGWFITPFVALAISLGIAWYILPFLRLRGKNPLNTYRILSVLLTAGACFQAYTFGANRIGFVTGPIRQAFGEASTPLYLLAIVGMILGPAVVGRRFIKVLGRDITRLDPGQGFSVNMGSAVSVYAMTLFGLPASFDIATVGGVVGAGSSKGLHQVRTRVVKKIAITWVGSIVLSLITAYLLAFGYNAWGGLTI